MREIIVAGAGAGKTEYLRRSIEDTLASGVPPEAILALTFSTRAAAELRERVARSTGARVTATTVHSLGLSLLRAHGDLLGFRVGRRQPRVLSESAREALWEKAEGDRQRFQELKRAHNVVDFDDMLALPLEMLSLPDERVQLWRARWAALFVDEAQDLSLPQLDLILAIVPHVPRVVVAGDPCQAIYGFAGALGSEAIERLRAALPDAQVRYLPHNLRSSALVARFSGAIVGRAEDAPRPGGMVAVFAAADEREEARMVAGEVERVVKLGVARPSQVAVLSRARERLALVERELLARGVPCLMHGRDGGLLAREEVRDLLAHLAVGVDPGDHLALGRVAATYGLRPEARIALRGSDAVLTYEHLRDEARVGKLAEGDQQVVARLLRIIQRLAQIAAEPAAQAVQRLAGPLKLAAEDAAALVALADAHGSVEEFLAELDAMTGADPLAPALERVNLMTIHAAKGAEFEVTFLVGAEEGVLPSRSALDEAALAEEQRLAYVACSRPRRALVVSFAQQREGRPTEPSRFLRGLPREGVQRRPDWRTA